MLPIPSLGGNTVGLTVLTMLAATAPAIVAWMGDRRLLDRANDPALPELLASRRRNSIRVATIALAVMLVVGGARTAWGIPLLIAMLIAAGYPLRTRILGETWGFGPYLWHTAMSIVGGFGFWIALAYAPTLVQRIVATVGPQLWIGSAVAAAIAIALVAWEAWYPKIWLSTHAARPLADPGLTTRFDEIVRRAGTVSPNVFSVGPQGSRFVNAVALPSAKRSSVAMGNALIDLLEPDEIAAIFAHEVAHFDQSTPKKVRRAQLTNRVLIVVGVSLPLIAAVARVPWAWWIGWLWPVVVLVVLARRAAKSQERETESDLRAAALCGDPEALVRGLVKLHFHARIPRRYAVDVERTATHPSLVRRIQAIRASGTAAIEQLGAPTVIRSTRMGSWVVLEESRAYWLDGVPDDTSPELAPLRDAASSYRAVNYGDLVELRVTAAGESRTLTARGKAQAAWSVPIAIDDVARVQRALDVVDLRLARPVQTPTAARLTRLIAPVALLLGMIAGQIGILLVPIVLTFWRPGPAAFAALGAMSVARAVLGAFEGGGYMWSTVAFRLALAALAAVGLIAIVVAARNARAGDDPPHQKLALQGIAGTAIVVALGAGGQFVSVPAATVIGSSAVGMLATAVFGLGAVFFTMRPKWARPAAYSSLVAASLAGTLSVDRKSVALRGALTEVVGQATGESTTDLGGTVVKLQVSPNGTRFLAERTTTLRRANAGQPGALVVGTIGGPVRELTAVGAGFVDDDQLLVLEALDRALELRFERVDSAGVSRWADTIPGIDLIDARLVVDREAGAWTIVGTEPDSDRTTVLLGKIGASGTTHRLAIPDTIAMVGEPIVFSEAATVFVPAYSKELARAGTNALWMLPFLGRDPLRTELWRVRGDSVSLVTALRGMPQCGEVVRGEAACAVRQMNATVLYRLNERGEATPVAELSSRDIGVAGVGPGLRAASMSFDRSIAAIDLVSRRLTRIKLPAGAAYASEIRVGDGWVVVLEFDPGRKSYVRRYRVGK